MTSAKELNERMRIRQIIDNERKKAIQEGYAGRVEIYERLLNKI